MTSESNKLVRDKMLFEVRKIEKTSKKLKELLEKTKARID